MIAPENQFPNAAGKRLAKTAPSVKVPKLTQSLLIACKTLGSKLSGTGVWLIKKVGM